MAPHGRGPVCLDMLRTRKSRREEPLGWPVTAHSQQDDPEQEALLTDSVGHAMLVVLDRLAPAERIAFVLHDLFAVPFDEIAPIVGRTPVAAKNSRPGPGTGCGVPRPYRARSSPGSGGPSAPGPGSRNRRW